jgi:hypothetical protein
MKSFEIFLLFSFLFFLSQKLRAQIPANDECQGAFQLSASLFCSPFSASNLGASQSIDPAQNCNGFTSTAAMDVWFRFTAFNATDSILVDGLGGLDAVVQIFAGNCGNLFSIACTDNPGNGIEKISPGNLIPGQEYLVRVYGWNGAMGNFSICHTYWGPPANDDCENALFLNSGDTCQFTFRNTFNATPSSGFQDCAGFADDDVWFRFVAPSNGIEISCTQIFVTGRAFFIFDAVLELYSSCSPASFLKCANTPASNPVEKLRFSQLTPGQIYYIRVYHSGLASGNRGFEICLRNAPCQTQIGQAKLISPITTDVLSNGSVQVGVAGHVGNLVWEKSEDGIQFVADSSKRADTVVFIPKISQTKIFYFRAKVWNGICDTLLSDTLSILVRCHNPFAITNLNDLVHITKMELPEKTQNSGYDLLGGAYQDFRKNPISICFDPEQPNQRLLGFHISNPVNAYQRYVWIDLNQNGSFGDAGELFHNGPPVAGGSQAIPLNFPAGLAAGQYTMRLAVVWASAISNLSNPCDNKAISYGELEEYSLLIRYKPVLSAGIEQFVCSPQAQMQARKPGLGYSGTWTKMLGSGFTGAGQIANPGDTNTLISNLLPGLNGFYWTVTGPCGTFKDSVFVHYLNQKSNAGSDQLICSPATTLSGNAPPLQAIGTWSVLQGTGIFFNPQAPNTSVSGLSVGVNRFVWTQSSAFCPTSRDTVKIETKAPPSPAVAGNNVSICGNHGNLSANQPIVGSGIWTLISGTGTISNPNANNSGVSNLGWGPNVFRWTISNAPCAPSSAQITLTAKPTPSATAGPDQVACQSSARLRGQKSLGATGVWSRISGTGLIQNPNMDTTRVLEITDSVEVFVWTVNLNNCLKKDSVTIRRYFNLLDLGNDTTICQDSSLLLSIPSSFQNIVWNNGNTSSSLQVQNSGLYWVQIKTSQNCVYRDSIQVNVSPCVSVSEMLHSTWKMAIYPNPAFDKIYIWMPEKDLNDMKINFYDALGKLLERAKAVLLDSKIEFDLSGIPSGIFWVEIVSEKSKWRKRVRKL